MKDFMTSTKRELLFISHANPEDNEFAKWITAQLAAEGYPVFCELFNLLGGEDAWKNIEKVLREKTVKVLFVLSKTSNQKDGTRKELNLAQQLARKHSFEDFVIPLLIDEIPHSDVCIELQTIIPIHFENGWAKGLTQLIEKLERQSISKSENFTPSIVSTWWRDKFSANAGIRDESEEMLSNWFEIDSLPGHLYFHIYKPGVENINEFDERNRIYPFRDYENGVISFANTNDFPDYTRIFGDTRYFYIEDLFKNIHSVNFLDDSLTRVVLIDLLRQAWEKCLVERGLETYEMASGSIAGYLVKDKVEKDKL